MNDIERLTSRCCFLPCSISAYSVTRVGFMYSTWHSFTQLHTLAFLSLRSLRVVNPSPYMAYLQARGCILVASSPEILCRVDGDGIVTNRYVFLLIFLSFSGF